MTSIGTLSSFSPTGRTTFQTYDDKLDRSARSSEINTISQALESAVSLHRERLIPQISLFPGSTISVVTPAQDIRSPTQKISSTTISTISPRPSHVLVALSPVMSPHISLRPTEVTQTIAFPGLTEPFEKCDDGAEEDIDIGPNIGRRKSRIQRCVGPEANLVDFTIRRTVCWAERVISKRVNRRFPDYETTAPMVQGPRISDTPEPQASCFETFTHWWRLQVNSILCTASSEVDMSQSQLSL